MVNGLVSRCWCMILLRGKRSGDHEYEDSARQRRAGAGRNEGVRAASRKGTQRYIRRSLDVGLGRRDAVKRWSRDAGRSRQHPRPGAHLPPARPYPRLRSRRQRPRRDGAADGAAGHDDRLRSRPGPAARFASYRFLYERLIGAAVRPWLPGAFCAAAALPHLHPDRRRTLLQSISEAAATAPGWSNREPVFFPEWVEKVDITVAG